MTTPKDKKNYTVYIVPTTHWDREWVQTQGQYQVRLVRLVDNLMDILDHDPSFRSFTFDGQTIVLEDYLEIKPHNRERLAHLIAAGRIVVGPWYVLADQFLEDGESTIRNLIIGFRMSREYGAEPMKVGYVPDSFGCIETLPMFMGGFGVPYIIFGHGRPNGIADNKLEFIWQGPDGAKILTASHGYGGGTFISYPDVWTNIEQALPQPELILKTMITTVEKMKDKESTSNLYLSVGIDHLEPRDSLPEVIDYLNKHMPGYELRITNSEDFMRAVEDEGVTLPAYRGEMSGPDVIPLNGVASSHIKLKQANFRSQRWLERYVEPLSLMGTLVGQIEYPAEHIDRLWRLLISNHAHDSICGCSIDRVHQDMINRYARIEDVAKQLTEYAVCALTPQINTLHDNAAYIPVIVFNTLAYKRTDLVKQWIRIPKRFDYKNYSIVDNNGHILPSRISLKAVKQQDLETLPMTIEQLATVLSKDAKEDRPDNDIFTVLEIEFIAPDVPSLGYKTFWIKPEISPSLKPNVWLIENGMANEYLKILFNKNGSFHIFDKHTNNRFGPLNYFEDIEEVGDAYGHRTYGSSIPLTTLKAEAEIEILEILPFRITYSIKIPWNLPVESCPAGRSGKENTYPVSTYVTLYGELARVEIKTEFNNSCKDHRLRAVFDTNVESSVSYSEGNFSITERKIFHQEDSTQPYPHQSFVDISGKEAGICLMNRGIPEFEAIKAADGTVRLYLTLIRCVGQLGPSAGANHPVFDAQCLGSHCFEYAIYTHSRDWQHGKCLKEGHGYTIPLWADGALQEKAVLPSEASFLKSVPEIEVTAFKKAENNDGAVVRLWNPTDESTNVQLNSLIPISSAVTTNLNEEVQADCLVDDNSLNVEVKARGLTTVKYFSHSS